MATRFTDTNGYFVSEWSVYRLLKVHDLITSPAFIVIKAADEFKDKTTAPNQLWQTTARNAEPSRKKRVSLPTRKGRTGGRQVHLPGRSDGTGRGCRVARLKLSAVL